MRLVLYTGKGGVGKTTTAAAAAVRAAELGRRTLVASADPAHSLGDVLEAELSPEPSELAPGLWAVELDATVETARVWGRVREYLVELLLHQGVDGSVAEELALLPGAEELTTLLAVERLAESGGFDHVVVDCAPTDATLRLTTLPDVTRGMLRVALGVMRTLSGAAAPVARHLISLPLPDRAVFEKLESLLERNLTRLHARITHPTTSVRLVVTPERMVIDEARRAHTELALFEVPCDAVVMNRLLPDAAGQEPFFADAVRVQRERLREVEELFDPLPLLEAPLGEDEVTGLERLSAHARRVFGAMDPTRVLCDAPALRFERDGEARIAVLPLPGADPRTLDVAKVAGDLIVSTPARRRALALPRGYAPLALAGAELSEGRLRVRFLREAPA